MPGLDIDAFAPRLSFFWAIGMNYFMESRQDAGRAPVVGEAHQKRVRARRTPSRWRCGRTARPAAGASPRRTPSTTSRAPAIEALAATHGGTQSLHTNALDEAIALPTDFSARIARNTQLFIQQETGTCRVADPWGGSHYVERLTYELVRKAQAHIAEVEELGGMTKAIAAGIPKMRIEEASARTQARIDSGTQTIVGVNKYRVTDEADIEVLKVDNRSVRESQLAKLARLKAERDPQAVTAALAALTDTAKSGTGNLLERAVAAARAKATVGEISDAMEKVWGRHRAESRVISGVYTAEAGSMSKDVERVRAMCAAFEAADGRRPRILVARWARTATTAARR